MAETGIFTNNTEVVRKAGLAGSGALSTSGAATNDYITQAESFINVAVGFNFSDNYDSLNTDVKGILKEIASNIAATYVVAWNFGAENSSTDRLSQEDTINVLRDRALTGIAILRDKKKVDFINAA